MAYHIWFLAFIPSYVFSWTFLKRFSWLISWQGYAYLRFYEKWNIFLWIWINQWYIKRIINLNAFQIYDIVTKFRFVDYMLLDPSQIDMLTWKLPNYSDSKSYTHTWNSYSSHYRYCCVPYSFLLLDCSSCYYCYPRGQKPFPIAKIHPFVVGFVVFTINWYVC